MTNTIKSLNKLLAILIFGLVVLVNSSVSAFAGSFDFNPPGKQFISGCRNSININVDPGSGKASNAADIEMYFNPNEVTVLDSDSNIPGVQIKSGNAYESYFGNQVDQTSGKILLAGASFVGELSSKKTFATIEFTNKPSITTISFNIKFDGIGATLDSNIAEASTSDDILTSVTNGTYTFIPGDCVRDTVPPVINFQQPTNYATGVDLESAVKINITDNLSGVDLSTVQFNINGDIYTTKDSEVTYTGTALNYTFTINPRNPFYSDKASQILAQATDLRGNQGRGQIIFNIPIEEKVCPAINPDTNNNYNNSSNVLNFLPQTGGNIDTSYAQKIDFESKNNTFIANSDVNSVATKPVLNNIYTAKYLDSSLKTIQILAFGNLLIAILGIFLFWWSGRKFYIDDLAVQEKTKQPIVGETVTLIDLFSGEILGKTTTSEYGDYMFQVKAGTYKTIVENGKHSFANVIIVNSSGEIRKLKDSTDHVELRKPNQLLNILGIIAPGMSLAGFIFAICNFLFVSSLLNILILALYMSLISIYWIWPLVVNKLKVRQDLNNKNKE